MEEIQKQLKTALNELYDVARLPAGALLVVGCSTSEVLGNKIGSNGSEEAAAVLFDTINTFCRAHGIYFAAQCCEHLNRALVIEKEAYDALHLCGRVNVVPHPHAGGSFATAVYHGFSEPYVVERVRADAGIDIGDTFIGMHLKQVAVPVRVSVSSIGKAHLTLARTRIKYIGGPRAMYDDNLM